MHRLLPPAPPSLLLYRSPASIHCPTPIFPGISSFRPLEPAQKASRNINTDAHFFFFSTCFSCSESQLIFATGPGTHFSDGGNTNTPQQLMRVPVVARHKDQRTNITLVWRFSVFLSRKNTCKRKHTHKRTHGRTQPPRRDESQVTGMSHSLMK